MNNGFNFGIKPYKQGHPKLRSRRVHLPHVIGLAPWETFLRKLWSTVKVNGHQWRPLWWTFISAHGPLFDPTSGNSQAATNVCTRMAFVSFAQRLLAS